MKYKYLGRLISSNTIKQEKMNCDWCGVSKQSLCGLKEIDTNEKVNLCDDCKDKIYNQIDFVR